MDGRNAYHDQGRAKQVIVESTVHVSLTFQEVNDDKAKDDNIGSRSGEKGYDDPQSKDDVLVCCQCLNVPVHDGLRVGECGCLVCSYCLEAQSSVYCTNCRLSVKYIKLRELIQFPRKGNMKELFLSEAEIENMKLSDFLKAKNQCQRKQMIVMRILTKQEAAWGKWYNQERKEEVERQKDMILLQKKITAKEEVVSMLEESFKKMELVASFPTSAVSYRLSQSSSTNQESSSPYQTKRTTQGNNSSKSRLLSNLAKHGTRSSIQLSNVRPPGQPWPTSGYNVGSRPNSLSKVRKQLSPFPNYQPSAPYTMSIPTYYNVPSLLAPITSASEDPAVYHASKPVTLSPSLNKLQPVTNQGLGNYQQVRVTTSDVGKHPVPFPTATKSWRGAAPDASSKISSSKDKENNGVLGTTNSQVLEKALKSILKKTSAVQYNDEYVMPDNDQSNVSNVKEEISVDGEMPPKMPRRSGRSRKVYNRGEWDIVDLRRGGVRKDEKKSDVNGKGMVMPSIAKRGSPPKIAKFNKVQFASEELPIPSQPCGRQKRRWGLASAAGQDKRGELNQVTSPKKIRVVKSLPEIFQTIGSDVTKTKPRSYATNRSESTLPPPLGRF